MNLSLLRKLQGPGGRGEPGGVPLRNEQLTGHSASTHPRSRATSWQQTPLPQGLHVTCWEEPKYLPGLPWGRREGTELLTQSPHGRMARGSDPARWGLGSCLSRRGVRSASQNRVGGGAVVWHRLDPQRGTLHARPTGASACPPPAGSGRRPTGGRRPRTHCPPPCGHQADVPAPAPRRAGEPPPPSPAESWARSRAPQNPGWSSAGSSNCISHLHEGPRGLCLPFISLSRGRPEASAWLTHVYGQG